jgi:Xaa-Pro aminopeptidase
MLSLPEINFRRRLDQVISKLNGHAMLIMAQPQAYRNSTVEAPWRQDGLFYYLTGFSETDAALLVLSHRGPSEPRVILFLRDKDPHAELWNGLRMGVAAAKEKLPIDEAFSWDDLWQKLPNLLNGAQGLFYSLGFWHDFDRKVIESLRRHRATAARNAAGMLTISDPSLIGGSLRVRKGPDEVARMKAAAKITSGAFARVLKELKPGQSERDVHATLLHEFLKGGAEMEAYGSIVAGGNNACVLHYRDNNAILRDGELLLIDAGCQVDNYASDVTRTFPINGKFTSAQKSLYSICLQSQKDAIAAAKPGATWVDVQDAAFKTLTKGLIDIGLIKESLDEALQKNIHKQFCPHGISHWIGLDVHDAGMYKQGETPVPFEPGMYFSVEPGIYINSSDQTVPEEFRGIGIRIEDDVLITATGNEVLTASIPKEIADVERL